MQRDPQTKTAIRSPFSSALSYQKPFFKQEMGFKPSSTVLSKKRLTNKFINLIMTNGEKEKAFKNLQTTLFHLNQKRMGKGKAVLDTLPLKGEEKRKSVNKEVVSGLPLGSGSIRTPLQLATRSLKDTVFQKSFSFFLGKKKVSQLSLIEVNCSLLPPIGTALESPSLQKNKGEKVGRKEKGWYLSSKGEKRGFPRESGKRLESPKNPFFKEKGGEKLLPLRVRTSVFNQSSFSKSGKEGSSTFPLLLLDPILFFQGQRLPSIQEMGKRECFLFNPQTLSFKDLSLLEPGPLSFSPFLKDLRGLRGIEGFREGSQKQKKTKVVCREKSFSSEKDLSLSSPSAFSLGEKRSFPPLSLSLSVGRATLSFLFPLWVCFKKGKRRLSSVGIPTDDRQRGQPLCFQRKDSPTQTDLFFQKPTTLTAPKEKQRGSLSGEGVKKVTKKNQRTKDFVPIPISTGPKDDKTEENRYPFHLRVLYKGVSQVRPLIEVRKVRKGGNTFQVPAFVKGGKGDKMGLTWLIEKGREKSLKSTLSFSESLCFNLLQSFEKSGEARQKRDQLLRLALSNRPYTRFRWW